VGAGRCYDAGPWGIRWQVLISVGGMEGWRWGMREDDGGGRAVDRGGGNDSGYTIVIEVSDVR